MPVYVVCKLFFFFLFTVQNRQLFTIVVFTPPQDGVMRAVPVAGEPVHELQGRGGGGGGGHQAHGQHQERHPDIPGGQQPEHLHG